MDNLNITEIAKKVGKSRQHISMVLGGTATPSIETARKLARVLGRSIFDFRPDLKEIFRESIT